METNKKYKHLTLDDRLEIENGLNNNYTFKDIGELINKDSSTISKEVRNHIQFKNIGGIGRPFNNCIHRINCKFKEKGKLCNLKSCEHFVEETCKKLLKPPYVCNGCKLRSSCTLSKRIYSSSASFNEYKETLTEAREGITYTQEELVRLENILYPLIVEQGQSVHHACITNPNTIMVSEKEIYILINIGAFPRIKNIHLPRKVRFRQRPKRTNYYKIDKKCLEGRRYNDYLKHIEENKDINIVQMDTVEGKKGGKVLLTIHFVNCSFMLAFIRDYNDAKSVINIFNYLEDTLGINTFKKLFPLILTDNGSEFSNPKAIEFNENTGKKRTQIFYCEPGRSNQKGSCEVNHELIRRVLPKGSVFDNLTQEDINKLMSNINSYKREKLNNCGPIQLFNLMYGNDIAKKLDILEIEPNKVNLSKNLLKKD